MTTLKEMNKYHWLFNYCLNENKFIDFDVKMKTENMCFYSTKENQKYHYYFQIKLLIQAKNKKFWLI
jgi:hypothetical protein